MISNENDKTSEQPENENSGKPKEPQKITIELYKYKTLIEALSDRHKVMRVVFTIFLLGVLLFAGITVVTLSIKRLYPYSDITTNGLGATTIKSEKNEVSYWLFNTAILWANSGIHVEKGDIITIRSSGKSHTAIHHLYQAASDNKEKRNDWVGSGGETDEMSDRRDLSRRKFRIFPNMPSGALLMQVAEDQAVDNPEEGDPDNFYFIGKERQHIYINNGGNLYFAVNDIILDRNTIANMMWENIRWKYEEDATGDTKTLVDNYLSGKIDSSYLKKESLFTKEDLSTWRNYILTLFAKVFETEITDANKKHQLFKQQYDLLVKTGIPKNSPLTHHDSIQKLDSINHLYEQLLKESYDPYGTIGPMKLGYTHLDSTDALVCELSYYYGKNERENQERKKVWFEDNIGSFLIIVEKTK